MATRLLEWVTEFNDTCRIEVDVLPITEADNSKYCIWGDNKVYCSALIERYYQQGLNWYINGVLIFPSQTNIYYYVAGSLRSTTIVLPDGTAYSQGINDAYDSEVGIHWCYNMSSYFDTGVKSWSYRYEGLQLFEVGHLADYVNYVSEVPITYNWQSVPSISGKNGISLELAHHLDVNDGEPITTEDTTKFSRKWINNVGRIIETKLNE